MLCPPLDKHKREVYTELSNCVSSLSEQFEDTSRWTLFAHSEPIQYLVSLPIHWLIMS